MAHEYPKTLWSRYNFLWITLILFVTSLAGHWTAGWHAYQKEREEHRQPAVFAEFAVEATRDTLENWQSEFLQLIWQVAGLAYFLYLGSPQSKEGDDRKEAKIDYIVKLLDKEGDKVIQQLDQKFPRTT